jgi:uncharacterized protein (TIGR02145 family)
MRKILSVFILILLTLVSVSQKIENVHAEQQDNQVKITFDISGAETDQQFDVRLFYSQNGYDWKQAIKGLTGAIGIVVPPGFSKTITWNAIEDVDKLVGKGFLFKVKATMTSNSVNVKNKEEIDNNSFSGTSGSFNDSRDGKTYKWVKIGDQIWMAENLNFITSTPNWCYESNINNCITFGRLYDWESAQLACPNGWHLPSDDEWNILVNFFGGENIAGGMMQAVINNNGMPNKMTNNSIEFNALFGGFLYDRGIFQNKGSSAYFWTSSESGNNRAWGQKLDYNKSNIYHFSYYKKFGLSVRCIKDY